MTSLKDFIKSQKNTNTLPAPKLQQAAIQVSGTLMALGVGISKENADEFGNQVMRLAASDEVMSELSQKLGKPHKTETEEEFVNRAKATLKSILKKNLTKK